VIKSTYLLAVLVLTAAAVLVPAAAPPASSPAPATRPFGAPAKGRPDRSDAFFATGIVPRLRIDVDPRELRRLNDRPREPVRAIVRELTPGQPDVVYCDVGVHLKGGPGSFRRVEDKPALTLMFDKFVPGQTFHGLAKFSLNNSVQDGSYLCEYLGSFIFREAGCPAPRVSAARVWLNGRDLGPFVLKEGFDDVFFAKYFKKNGNLYEGSFTDVDGMLPVHVGVHLGPPPNVEFKAGEKQLQASLAAQRREAEARWRQLADAAREADPIKRHNRMEAVLDVDRFLTFLACEAMVAHWDGYGGNRNNYRVYDDPKSGKFVFLPQGMDQLFQRPDYPLFANGALVAQVLTQNAEDRQRFYERLAEIRQRVFTPEILTSQIEQQSARIEPLMREINKDLARQQVAEAAGLKQRVLERIKGIDKQLANPPQPLKFDPAGVALLSKADWEVKVLEGGEATPDKVEESGKPRLRIVVRSPGGNGSWRTSALLPQGMYSFEGQVKTVGVVAPKLENCGAGLRISGDKTLQRLRGDNPWQLFKYEFEVTESLKEVVLICDLKGEKGQAYFDPASLVLRKK
jgi:hypothetical protein